MRAVLAFLAAASALACSGQRRAATTPSLPPAFTVAVRALPNSPIAMGCLPRTGDSTLFRINVIIDSTQPGDLGAFAVILNPRAQPRPGFVNQVVSVELERAGAAGPRFTGTACWHDSGIVFRMPAHVLAEAIISLDPRKVLEVDVFAGSGTPLARVTLDHTTEGRRIAWAVPPPDINFEVQQWTSGNTTQLGVRCGPCARCHRVEYSIPACGRSIETATLPIEHHAKERLHQG